MTVDNATYSMLARLLGVFFYYPPNSPITRPVTHVLLQLDQLAHWQNPDLIAQQCQQLADHITHPELDYHYSVLFEGQGHMIAPPWGSVYLDKEGLLMGESEAGYRAFLQQHGLKLDTGINEPEDHFGLMLMAFALFIEQNKIAAAKQLLEQHLMCFAPSYLHKLTDNGVSPFYQSLAIIAREYLTAVCLGFLHLDPKHV